MCGCQPAPPPGRGCRRCWKPTGTGAPGPTPAGIKNNQNYYIAQPWNARGYAYVFADLRGTGASFGTLNAELGRQLVADVGSLADWIAAQPWSNGRVGVTGVSYSADIAMSARWRCATRTSPPPRRSPTTSTPTKT